MALSSRAFQSYSLPRPQMQILMKDFVVKWVPNFCSPPLQQFIHSPSFGLWCKSSLFHRFCSDSLAAIHSFSQLWTAILFLFSFTTPAAIHSFSQPWTAIWNLSFSPPLQRFTHFPSFGLWCESSLFYRFCSDSLIFAALDSDLKAVCWILLQRFSHFRSFVLWSASCLQPLLHVYFQGLLIIAAWTRFLWLARLAMLAAVM